MIPYGKQNISQADVESVIEALKSDWLTQGPAVPAFEESLCGLTGAKYAQAVNSGTSALHLACQALGLSKGDTLWTSPNTFVASANCARYCGADIDFVDIDISTGNMSLSELEKKLDLAAKTKSLPKILVAVHFAGQSCDMQEIKQLSDKYGFKIIEDAAHAIGGTYKNRPIGAGVYSDATTYSFHPVKVITTGEGGAVLTNDKKVKENVARLRSHGITKDKEMLSREADGDWYYEQIELGFNYRMTEFQAALGKSQLTKLEEFVKERDGLARNYDELLKDLPLLPLQQRPERQSAWHLYVVRLQENIENKKKIFDNLKAKGLGVQIHYIPVHLQPYYRNLGFKSGDFPGAEEYYRQALTIPLYPGLKSEQQQYVVQTLQNVLL